jgi:hypothetical protein
LAALPDDLTLYYAQTQPLRVAHGVPGRNRVGFYNEQAATAIAQEIQFVQEKTLISAHTHVQIDRNVSMLPPQEEDLLADPHGNRRGRSNERSRTWHVINPGSVGLPLNGNPGAQFAVVESVPESESPGGWKATHYSVPYDRRPTLEGFSTTGMLDAGGVITELFYWELVMAGPEIIRFYRWSRSNGHEPDQDLDSAFAAYVAESGRREFVRQHDPLYTAV